MKFQETGLQMNGSNNVDCYRQPDDAEMKGTGIIRMKVESGR